MAAKKSTKRAPTKRASKSTTKKSATKKSTRKSTAKSTSPKVRSKLARYRRKRDFTKTAEPSGERSASSTKRLRFVIQKHAASHLHFDWRLELDGVMKSWAVPKGPSVVPGQRRLAMEVEDHPISYNTFEGTIPQGQYGGGTVMLWDRGWYEHTGAGGPAALREGYEKGKLDVTMHGERLKGAFTLVRTGEATGERSSWLLIKRTDEHANRARDIVAEVVTSVDSGRTMEQIAEGKRGRRVWHSNR
jgi:bifunctional non-homologous end joining protein LigD